MSTLLPLLRRLPRSAAAAVAVRPISISSRIASDEDPRWTEPRAQDETDVLIVGAGPSGLSAAIRIKQLAQQSGKDVRVCLLEKGGEVGAHILSGAVLEPRSLNELIPDWKEKGAPLNTPVKEDKFLFLTSKHAIESPIVPPSMHNDGNYIISLGQLCRWLAQQAEELGVEIYTGIAGSEVLYDESGAVAGVATNDVGISRKGTLKDSFARGMELRAKVTLFSEGVRGSLTKTLFDKFNLRSECDPQTYGIGLKELWEVPAEHHQPGLVIHTVGWPMDLNTYGGSFLYHLEDRKISIGYVVGLDYENPYLNPYKEFQRFKHHPAIRKYLEGGQVLTYGARAISEGGLQSLPKLIFPGGALIGDSAGFLNTPKIKGTHTAMKSGILAAEAAFEEISKSSTGPIVLNAYPENFKKSWLYEELHETRNIRPAFQKGFFAGMFWGALDEFIFKGKFPMTFRYKHHDHEATLPADQCEPIEYPKPDGKISFDLLTNLTRSGTNHEHDQPIHLKLRNPALAVESSLKVYGGPEQRFCPAGVYEYVDDGKGEKQLQINAQNCLHCKTCDIKDVNQNIDWSTPEGGGGPAYPAM
eukprot:TRINITY_DN2221_c0_g1_i1.p1 TRINITY_DN2221_c0_g1~~TRINITY_DN2221_c0_g1_i1.p1  ORF type:complete len:586 (+),score=123.96 TRINITY_DN2221_c0_g1_i1:59-1816(+)